MVIRLTSDTAILKNLVIESTPFFTFLALRFSGLDTCRARSGRGRRRQSALFRGRAGSGLAHNHFFRDQDCLPFLAWFLAQAHYQRQCFLRHPIG